MKKILLSVGLVAAGTSGLQAAYAPDQGSMDATRMWSLSGSLRGFYDNNYTTGNSQSGSGGFEVSPAISINVPMQQTEFGMRFIYGLYYYQARENQGENPIDQTFRTDLWLDHAFTERWQTRVEDTFLIAQDPELNTGGPVSNPIRTSQSYLVNNGTVTLHTDWTREFSTSLYYHSDFWNYQNDNGTAANPSLAGELNRIGNSVGIDFQWHQSPTTMFFFGYQFSQVNYTADEPIAQVPLTSTAPVPPPGFIYFSDSRNSRSQAVYLGTTHNFAPNLVFSGRFGAQYSDYYNDPQNSQNNWNPYGNLSLTYTYQPGCFAEIGFTESMNSTDEIAVDANNGSITVSQQSSVIYGSINHQITPKLRGSLVGQVQFSSFNGGTYDGDVDDLYSAGLNFSYAFNRHFSADIGDNFDQLNSQIPGRGYNRNRVYAGVTATY
ncbi:MAG: outer membrane beta-barrel protein [Verrucomicrobiales bacterium]|nr:outer membrane beta-barrel protein [Verrucomicrobiales bacterium]